MEVSLLYLEVREVLLTSGLVYDNAKQQCHEIGKLSVMRGLLF